MQNNIIVAFGGVSPEHEVSVLTAMQAIAALKETVFPIIPLYVTKGGRWLTGDYLLELEHYQDLEKVEEQAVSCTFSHNKLGKPVLLETEKKGIFSKSKSFPIHAVIPAFHGSEGENGAFQGTCEMYNIPYAGSGILASSLGMNKVKAKEFFSAHGVPVVEDVSFFEQEWDLDRENIIRRCEALGYPLIVKPVNLGSSIGVMKSKNKEELINSVETAFRYDNSLMVEKAVTPLMEINCSVLGSPEDARASVCEQPLAKEETLSFEDKYQSGGGGGKGMASADRIIPAEIPDDLTHQIQETAKSVFKLIMASGVARIDFLMNADTKEFYFNEVNTIPGSFSFYLWKENGMNMKELMLELIEIAVKRHRLYSGRIRSYETNLLNEKAIRGIKGLKGTQND